MKILIAVADYPDNHGKVTLMYVHTRNVYYKKAGIDVTVLNFAAKEDYAYDGVDIITLNSFKKCKKSFDILLCHAANIRNHYLFLKKYGNCFKNFIFFYHGHEVLKCNKVYSRPYSYVRKNILNDIKQDLYDDFKLFVWRRYLPKIAYKSYFVFVSNWMKDEFFKWTKIKEKSLEGRTSITYNSIGELFEKNAFDQNCKKEFDFVTIRNNMDGSKYSIDIVNRIAFNTPNKKFLVVGKGEFFKHYDKAPNIKWLDTTMNHQDIIAALQKCRYALMPTRTDAQGLMMCEMAAFGIPVITSDIPVCHEIFGKFENVYYIKNDDLNINLNKFDKKKSVCIKHMVYYKEKTVSNEVNIIKRIFNKG